MAALVTLTEGDRATRSGAPSPRSWPPAAPPATRPRIAAALRDALPDEADTDHLAPIIPDIIGEAAILAVLEKRTKDAAGRDDHPLRHAR